MFEKVVLPELIGSEKQILWAETIRESFMEKAKRLNKDITNVLENERHAKFYIDNRNIRSFDFIGAYDLYLSIFKFDLPNLEGTSQQIKWGETVRDEMLCKVSIAIREVDSDNLIQLFTSKSDSTYFIANKDADYKEIVALAFAFVESSKIEPLLPALVGPEANRLKANKKRHNALERDYKAFYLGKKDCCKEDIFEAHLSKTSMDDYKI